MRATDFFYHLSKQNVYEGKIEDIMKDIGDINVLMGRAPAERVRKSPTHEETLPKNIKVGSSAHIVLNIFKSIYRDGSANVASRAVFATTFNSLKVRLNLKANALSAKSGLSADVIRRKALDPSDEIGKELLQMVNPNARMVGVDGQQITDANTLWQSYSGAKQQEKQPVKSEPEATTFAKTVEKPKEKEVQKEVEPEMSDFKGSSEAGEEARKAFTHFIHQVILYMKSIDFYKTFTNTKMNTNKYKEGGHTYVAGGASQGEASGPEHVFAAVLDYFVNSFSLTLADITMIGIYETIADLYLSIEEAKAEKPYVDEDEEDDEYEGLDKNSLEDMQAKDLYDKYKPLIRKSEKKIFGLIKKQLDLTTLTFLPETLNKFKYKWINDGIGDLLKSGFFHNIDKEMEYISGQFRNKLNAKGLKFSSGNSLFSKKPIKYSAILKSSILSLAGSIAETLMSTDNFINELRIICDKKTIYRIMNYVGDEDLKAKISKERSKTAVAASKAMSGRKPRFSSDVIADTEEKTEPEVIDVEPIGKSASTGAFGANIEAIKAAMLNRK